MPTAAEVEQLLSRADSLPYGPERVSLVEEAMRLADTVGDDRLAYDTRFAMIEAANWSGHDDRSVVALAWCWGYVDRNGEAPDLYSLLWRQKWVLGALSGFCRVQKQQIVAMEDDFARRLSDAGYNLRPVEDARWGHRLIFGEGEEADHFYERWAATERDAMADCLSCDYDSEAWYRLCRHRNEEALSHAMDLIDKKKPGCQSVPHRTFYKATIALLRLGRIEEARALYPRAMRMIGGKPGHTGEVTAQLLYLLRDGEASKALRQVDRHLAFASDNAHDHTRRNFFAATALVLEAVADKSSRRRKLKLPTEHPLYRDDHTYNTSEIAAWYAAEANELASRFDERNGNTSVSDWLAEMRVLAGM